MKIQPRFIAVALVTTLLGACAFVPKTNLRLDEARRAHSEARADPLAAQYSSIEMSRAEESLQRANTAWSTLDDPAVVDHLAYVARQRFAIAREAAKRMSAERRLNPS